MLKIIDDVDLEELEKFKFRKIDDLGVIDYLYSKEQYDLIVSNSRILYLQSDYAISSDIPDELLEILYDLTKAGLVEKVCEDKPQYLGYSDKECINCGRLRVEKYSDGTEICEKCNFDQNKKEYILRGEE